jgi:KaiC/GvpD/RAD55 family RecA-like ATPase
MISIKRYINEKPKTLIYQKEDTMPELTENLLPLINYYRGDKPSNRLERSPYIPTLIPGFDDLLRGGLLLPYHQSSQENDELGSLVILIKGQPGTGKTTLASQILLGILQCEKNRRVKEFNCTRKDKPDITFKAHCQKTQEAFIRTQKDSLVFTCEQGKEEYLNLLMRLLTGGASEQRDRDNRLLAFYFSMFLMKAKGWSLSVEDELDFHDIQRYILNRLYDFTHYPATPQAPMPQLKSLNSFCKEFGKYFLMKPKMIPILPQRYQLTRLIAQISEACNEFLPDDASKSEFNRVAEKLDNILKEVELPIGQRKNNDPTKTPEAILYSLVDALVDLISITSFYPWIGLNSTISALENQGTESPVSPDQDCAIWEELTQFVNNIPDSAMVWDFYSKFQQRMLGKWLKLETLTDSQIQREGGEISENKPRTFDVWLSDLMVELGQGKPQDDKKKDYRAIMIDGLNSFPSSIRRDIDAQLMIRYLRKRAWVSIIVYEDERDHHENLDYLADVVIRLESKEYDESPKYFMNKLIMEKSRFQQSVLGWHQYKIRSTGVEVFPSLHFRTHRLDKLNEHLEYSIDNLGKPYQNPNSNCGNEYKFHHPPCAACSKYKDPKGIPELLVGANAFLPEEFSAPAPSIPELKDGLPVHPNHKFGSLLVQLIRSRIQRGSITAVLGPRHTFKAQLTLDFLRTGSRSFEHGLLVSLQDLDPELKTVRRNLCNWVCRRNQEMRFQGSEICKDFGSCYHRVHSLILRPGCITPAEFFFHLAKRLRDGAVRGEPIRRLVLWDLHQMEVRFPFFTQDPLFLPSLIDYLKYSWAITTIIVGPSQPSVIQRMSMLADNVVFTWREEYKHGEYNLGDSYVFYCDLIQTHFASTEFTYLQRKEPDDCDEPTGFWEFRMGPQMIRASDLENPNLITEVSRMMRQRIWEMEGIRGIDKFAR